MGVFPVNAFLQDVLFTIPTAAQCFPPCANLSAVAVRLIEGMVVLAQVLELLTAAAPERLGRLVLLALLKMSCSTFNTASVQ